MTNGVFMYMLLFGSRLFDTAQIYGTEVPLGAAIKERNIPRDDVTIVTKLHPQYHGYESTISAVQESLENLQTDYIDVFLIHTKYCDGGYFKCPEGDFTISVVRLIFLNYRVRRVLPD